MPNPISPDTKTSYFEQHKQAQASAKAYLSYLDLGGSVDLKKPPLSRKEYVPVSGDATLAELQDELNTIENRIGYNVAPGIARSWWNNFENDNQRRLGLVVNVARALEARDGTVNDFYQAQSHAKTDNITGVLEYVSFRRDKKLFNERSAAAAALTSQEQLWLPVPTEWHLPLFKNGAGLEYQPGVDLKEQYKVASQRIQRVGTEGNTARFWEIVEEKFSQHPVILLRLAQEIAVSEKSAQDFFHATVFSGTDDLGANVHYLRYQKYC